MTAIDHLAALLPGLPADAWDDDPTHSTCLEGYDWISWLRGWYPVGSWGSQGWDLGSWPYMIAAHYDGPGLYGLVTYIEGDIDVTAYATREERDAATNEVAVGWWISNENGPKGLTSDMSPIPAAYCGPYPA